jgi:hypothetical protein
MALIAHKKLFYINSQNKLTGTNSRFTVNIPFFKEDNFDRVAVLNCTVPKSFYNVRAGQNSFTLTEGLQSTVIVIPPGNYSRRSLQKTLQDQLNASSPTPLTYTVSWPTPTQVNTGKFTFTCSNVGGIQPIFVFTDKLYRHLGFDKNSSNQFSSFSLISKNVINLQSDNVLYIHSDIASNGEDDILQEIWAAAGNPDYSNIHFENFDLEAYSKQLVSKTKTNYYFYLTDQDQKEVDLNGVNWNLTLILFRHNEFWQMNKQYIKYQLLKEDQHVETEEKI